MGGIKYYLLEATEKANNTLNHELRVAGNMFAIDK